MRLVVALGGNALLRRMEPLEASVQRKNVRVAAESLATLAREHTFVITHGNGPQVGLLALQSEAYASVQPYPLDILGAETEGMIGYLVENDLRNALPGQEFATLLTHVVVDRGDAAFQNPSKPIGPTYAEAEARQVARERGWIVGPDGPRWRRLVPSPEPRAIVQIQAIRLLQAAGVTVICAGGGGVPVVRSDEGQLAGVEAVVDKDLSAALLASSLVMDGLVMLTDVDAVYEDWGAVDAHPIRETSASTLRGMRFAAGSMGPKVEAACRFVEAGGSFAAIGALADASSIVAGTRGTLVRAA